MRFFCAGGGITTMRGRLWRIAWPILPMSRSRSMASLMAMRPMAYRGPTFCAVFAGRPGRPNVGWSFQLEITSDLSDGSRRTGRDHQRRHGAEYRYSNFSVANAASTIRCTSTSIPLPHEFARHQPRDTFPDGRWTISRLYGKFHGDRRSFRSERSLQPPASGCLRGISGANRLSERRLDEPAGSSSLADGTHTLSVTAVTTGGRSSVVTSSFTSTNSSGNPGIVVIDRPTTQTAVSSVP